MTRAFGAGGHLPRAAHLVGWGAYAPSQVLTNADLARMVDTNDEWIVKRTGIRERRVAGPHETTASMGAVAGLRAIAVAGMDPDEIDLILLATLTPDYWMPATAALVKEAIGNTRAFAMDVMAACSGFAYAYATAQAYIASGMARNVLVIGAEALTRFLDFTDRGTCILFGDGAGAVVLSASDEPGGALGFELTTEPSGAYMIWVPAGGAAAPPSASTVAGREHYIRMEGKETYRFATKTLAATALASIRKAGLAPSDIELFVPHQANIRIIEAVAKGLGLPMDKMFVNLDRYGNTSAASVPMALAEAVNAGRVKVGDHVCIVAFGAGLTSGAVTLQWTADPANGLRAESIRPEDVHIRMPEDWNSVDQLPPALAAILAAPGPVEVDLSDVVPDEPAATNGAAALNPAADGNGAADRNAAADRHGAGPADPNGSGPGVHEHSPGESAAARGAAAPGGAGNNGSGTPATAGPATDGTVAPMREHEEVNS
jgi:3-oxoacyl-[acyl-carrier-protein] synthase-3